MVIPLIIGYGTLAFCGIRVNRKISARFERVASLPSTNKLYKKEKRMQKAIFIQAMLPVLVTLPYILLYSLEVIFPSIAAHIMFGFTIGNIRVYPVDFIFSYIITWSPVIDALMTLIYRVRQKKRKP
jgi:hypothetical protein